MGFPITSDNNSDKIQRALTEGKILVQAAWVWPTAYNFDGTSTPEVNGGSAGTLASQQPVSGFSVNPTKAILASTVDIWISADCYVFLNFGSGSQGGRTVIGAGGKQYQNVIANGSMTISLAGLVRPTNPAGNKVLATFTIKGATVSRDLNWGATKSIMLLGDSNMEASAMVQGNGTSGALTGQTANAHDAFTWLLRGQYRVWGQDVRLIDKSEASKSTVDFEGYRTSFALSVMEAPNLIIYNLGTNDIDATVYQTNLSKFLNWATLVYSKAKIIVLSPIPKQNSTAEALAATMRTNAQTVVTGLANPNVIHINGGAAFTASDNNMYSGTEAAGSGIHMSIAGHTALANYIINQINTNYTAFKVL